MRTTSVGASDGSLNWPLTTSRSPATSAAVVGTLKSRSRTSSDERRGASTLAEAQDHDRGTGVEAAHDVERVAAQLEAVPASEGRALHLDAAGDAAGGVDGVQDAAAHGQQVAARQHADAVQPEAGRLDVVTRERKDACSRARCPQARASAERHDEDWLFLESVT